MLTSGLRMSLVMGNDTFIAGPLTGFFCVGIGAFMRPQILANYLIACTDTCEIIMLQHVSVAKESSALSIGAQVLKLRNCQLRSRIENWIADRVGIWIEL